VLDADTVIRHMIGRPLAEYFPKHIQQAPGEVLLTVEHLRSPGKFSDVSFQVRRGEIVGLAGLVGAGRTELAEAIFGLDPRARGRIFLLGQPLTRLRPGRLIASGLGLLPEDRKRHGLVAEMSIADNMTLPILPRLAIWGWLKRAQQYKLTQHHMDQLRIRAPSVLAKVATLSGGNQQKVMLARWLAAHCPVLILDEPTRGVDIGSKEEIRRLIVQLADQGYAFLVASSDIDELIAIADRILVMYRGRVAAEFTHDEATKQRIILAATTHAAG
jgi:ABC-type sugar transport system ATPase subunit